MLFFVTTRRFRNLIDMFLAAYARRLIREIRPIPYEELFRLKRYPAGSYLFADHERLSPEDLGRAGRVWHALEASGRCPHLLNHPNRVRRRYELLRTLHEAGANDFDVYRVIERRRPKRFPVFLRGENDHYGPVSPLLETQADLDQAVEAQLAGGAARASLLITEFCGALGPLGFYEKYSAFCVRGRVIPSQILYASHWCVKVDEQVNADTVAAEVEYLETNPHEEAVRRTFEHARIDYGRVDYGIVNGRLQCYEINTLPALSVAEDVYATLGKPSDNPRLAVKAVVFGGLVAALEELVGAVGDRTPIPAPRLYRKRAFFETDRVWSGVLRPLGLGHRLPLVLSWGRVRAGRRGARRARRTGPPAC